MKKKLLITGISGLLGSNLAYRLKDRYEIFGFYHHQPLRMDGVETRMVDLRHRSHAESFIKYFNPDVLIHCAAQANVDICEEFRDQAWEINVKATQDLVDILKPLKTKLIYISTDLVYDGVKGRHQESDIVSPRNYYAKTKLEAEQIALSLSQSLILRTNFFGWGLGERVSLAQWVIEELRSGKRIQGFTDVFFSAIYTFDLAEIIHALIDKNIAGIYNCASRTSLSKYEFILDVAKQASLDISLITPASIGESSLKAQRSKNLSLDVSRLIKDSGVIPPTIEESITSFVRDLSLHYPEKIVARPLAGEYYPFLNTIPYGRQCIDDDDIQSVVDVLKSSNLTQGPKVEMFEDVLSDKAGAAFCAAVNSGTSALHIACLAAGIGSGDEVITSPNSFVASSNCVLYCGGRPVFADIDPKTYNISPAQIEKKISAKTKAVIPVHFAGQSCDMEAIQAIVKKAEAQFRHKIHIIEDASHALGSLYQNGKVGSCRYSDMSVMSFHPVKHITTGEGGAVLMNDRALYRKCCYLRSHGITSYPDEMTQAQEIFEPEGSGDRNPWYYEQQWLGYNYRITDLQCALGVSQLKKLDVFSKRRREIFELYNSLLAGKKGITIPYEFPACRSNFHLYVVLIDFELFSVSRAALIKELRAKGIQPQVHYIPIHTQPYYQKHLGTKWGDCPVAEKYYRQCLSLPLYPGLKDENFINVVRILKGILGDNL